MIALSVSLAACATQGTAQGGDDEAAAGPDLVCTWQWNNAEGITASTLLTTRYQAPGNRCQGDIMWADDGTYAYCGSRATDTHAVAPATTDTLTIQCAICRYPAGSRRPVCRTETKTPATWGVPAPRA